MGVDSQPCLVLFDGSIWPSIDAATGHLDGQDVFSKAFGRLMAETDSGYICRACGEELDDLDAATEHADVVENLSQRVFDRLIISLQMEVVNQGVPADA